MSSKRQNRTRPQVFSLWNPWLLSCIHHLPTRRQQKTHLEKGFSTGCSSRGMSSRNLESVFKMVESCCPPPWFEGWCHSEPLLLLGCVQTVSCARGKSRGRDFSPEGLDVGSGNDGADQASSRHQLLAWNFKDVDPLLSIDSHPHWVREVLGLKHPQRVPWGIHSSTHPSIHLSLVYFSNIDRVHTLCLPCDRPPQGSQKRNTVSASQGLPVNG